MTDTNAPGTIRAGSPAGRGILFATILGSGVAMLDGSVVNVALKKIGEDFNAPVADLQWTVNAYTLTLAGLILLGGSLGDRYGRRKIFVLGVVWFALASLLCGLSPNSPTLIAARALQGIGGALLTPGSLAIIQATFHPDDRAKAIGTWSGLGGAATAFGPFLGGWLVEAVSWRLVFLINLPLAALTVWVALRHVPETRDEEAHGPFDLAGAALVALFLAGITWSLIGATDNPGLAAVTGVAGLVFGAAFIVTERRRANPMLPLGVFKSRRFSAVNVVTFFMYAALSAIMFFLVFQLQIVAGYSPSTAGIATLPVTVCMMLLSGYSGGLAKKIGPRWQMTLGPLLIALGLLLMLRIDAGGSYWTEVLPGVLLMGLGLSTAVAPLTATVLASVPVAQAGIGSGVNNAVARAAGLLAVAGLPAVVGWVGDDYQKPATVDSGFDKAMIICAAMMVLSSLLAWFTVPSDALEDLPGEGPHAEPCATHGCETCAPPLDPGLKKS